MRERETHLLRLGVMDARIACRVGGRWPKPDDVHAGPKCLEAVALFLRHKALADPEAHSARGVP